MGAQDVVIKGPNGGIIICLGPSESFEELKKQLILRVDQVDDCFVGAQVVLDVGERRVLKKEMRELNNLLLERGLHLIRLISKGKTINISEEPDENQKTADEQTTDSLVIPFGQDKEAIVIRRTLRSGQTISFPGNVVILGDVNPGAEVIAGGNILVMGALRGLAHAGAMGEETAVVAAYRLNPTQIRIANHFTRPPDDDGFRGTSPEVAQMKDGKVVIEKFKV